MKTKYFFLLLSAFLLAVSCEKSEKLSAPVGLQGQQMGSTIVLAWNKVENAAGYEIWRNGTFLIYWYATNFTDDSPDNGYNSYEISAFNEKVSSPSSQINVFFDSNLSGGGGSNDNGGDGGSTPGGEAEQSLPITKSNLIGYWHGKTEAYSGSSTYDYSDIYINISNDGVWERIDVESKNKCAVTYGTWYLSGTTIYVTIVGENDFENGQCLVQYTGSSYTDLYGVELLTSKSLVYKTGQYPNLITYSYEKVSSIPASYIHNNDLNNGSNPDNGGSNESNLTVNKTNLTGIWTCNFNGDIYYWVLQSNGTAYSIADESSYMSRGSYHKFVGKWSVSGSSFIFNSTRHNYYDAGILDYSESENETEIVFVSSLSSTRFIDGDGNTWTKTTLPAYISL